jgi:hypothetical protein
VGLRELPQDPDSIRTSQGVRVGDDDEGRGGRLAPLVRVGGEAERTLVDDQPRVDVRRRRIGDDDELLDLRREGVQTAIEVRLRPVRDDDRSDGAAQSSSR